MSLAVACYRMTAKFPPGEVFGLTSQIRRAATSVPANIAEGYGRDSSGDYVRFLRVAQGSLKELETHLLLAERLDLCTNETVGPPLALADQLGRMLRSLYRSVQNKTGTYSVHEDALEEY